MKDIVNKVKEEFEVLQGDAVKDKLYTQEREYPDEAAATAAFDQARQKLFDVNKWSGMPGINSTFELYDARGRRSPATKPEVGYYLKIILPGPAPENWVQISDIREEANAAEFTVHPSPAPELQEGNETEVKHFFTKEASSTFRVERQGRLIKAAEIGKNEGINNQGEEAGDRSVINTLIAEGGWAGFQALQWDKLTRYLVHRDEAQT